MSYLRQCGSCTWPSHRCSCTPAPEECSTRPKQQSPGSYRTPDLGTAAHSRSGPGSCTREEKWIPCATCRLYRQAWPIMAGVMMTLWSMTDPPPGTLFQAGPLFYSAWPPCILSRLCCHCAQAALQGSSLGTVNSGAMGFVYTLRSQIRVFAERTSGH